MSYGINSLYGRTLLTRPPKRKVFISYHHSNDQSWYDQFSTLFSDSHELFSDNSLERALDSDNSAYLNRKIREEFIFGTSITILLCGVDTWKRRWIDWEIHATLEYEHALLGIALPTCRLDANKKILTPNRFYENWESNYAVWMGWTNDPIVLQNQIEAAINKSSQTSLIKNSTEKMKRSSE
jgi:hypothetical protein